VNEIILSSEQQPKPHASEAFFETFGSCEYSIIEARTEFIKAIRQ
jgi:hypothetical protein